MATESLKYAREIGKDYGMSFGDLVEKRDFGSFSVVRTTRGLMYENYTGYHIWTTAYAGWIDGTAKEKNLYSWLNHLMELAKSAELMPDEEYEGTGMTYSAFLDSMKILTESVLSYPMVAFADLPRATEFALNHMKWLRERSELLAKTAATEYVKDDDRDERILAEDSTRMQVQDTLRGMIDESAPK